MPKPLFKPEPLARDRKAGGVPAGGAYPHVKFGLVVPSHSPELVLRPRPDRAGAHQFCSRTQRKPLRHAGKPEGGLISLAIRTSDTHTIVEVADNGCGLPAEARDRLTEPYVTTRVRGTGLGLAIVKKIVEEHGGTLELGDAPGGGALARLRFDNAASHAMTGDDGTSSWRSKLRHGAGHPHRRRRSRHPRPDRGRAGRRGLWHPHRPRQRFSRSPRSPNGARRCLILDIWLQGSRLDGIELLEEVKRRDVTLPVIVISGHGNIETAVAAIKRGAYDFIEKPFRADQLLIVVDRATQTERLRRENEELKERAGVETELRARPRSSTTSARRSSASPRPAAAC